MGKIIKKIMIVIILCTTIIFSLFAGFSNRGSASLIRQSIEDQEYYKACSYANQVSAVFENAEGTVDTLVNAIAATFEKEKHLSQTGYLKNYMTSLDPVIKSTLLDINDASGLCFTFEPNLTDEAEAYEIWYAYDENDQVKLIDATLNGVFFEAFYDENAANMEYYFEAVKNPNHGVWTEPYLDPDTDENILSYSRAVYSNDLLLGVVCADILTTHTIDMIRNMNTDGNGELLLLNSRYQFILSSEKNYDEKLSPSYMKFWNTCISDMSSNLSGLLYTNFDNEALAIFYSHLSNDWILVRSIPQGTLFAPVNYMQFILVLLSFILALITIVTAYLSIKKFSYPVSHAASLLKTIGLENEWKHADKSNSNQEDDIEQLVQKVIEDQRQKEILIAHQSRQAQAGEMMANIAHQWKQPLNNINLILGNLNDEIYCNGFTYDSFVTSINRTEEIIQSMSETIDDFTDYLKPSRGKEYFSINKSIESAVDLVSARLKKSNTTIQFYPDTIYTIFGIKNILYHVIINVLNNAMDAIDESQRPDGLILITLKSLGGYTILDITNNGIPLSVETESKLFTPYFTTKESLGGTGIGLSLSKNILESSMDSSISLENTLDGVLCRISIKEELLNDK